MSMKTTKMQTIDPFFLKKPDDATIAKIDTFKKYFGIYLRLIDIIKNNPKNNAIDRRIKYIDLFSGPGLFVFDNQTIMSTPLEVVNNVIDNGYEEISFYFNDYNYKHIEALKENIDSIQIEKNKKIDVHYINKDAKGIDLTNIINNNDITISLIDSYSYLCLDKDTINKLSNNYYSDIVCYFRVANILEHIGNENEKLNHINILGTEEKYNNLYDMKKKRKYQHERINYLLKSWIENINKDVKQKYFLPIFIQFSHQRSKVESVVFIISKNKLGLNTVKSMLNDFEVDDGKYYFYKGSNINTNKLFDNDLDIIKEHIDTNSFISVKELIDKIDDSFIKEYGYISAYSEKYIKEKLKILESENILEFVYSGNGKRRKNTYGDNTKFRLIEGDSLEKYN